MTEEIDVNGKGGKQSKLATRLDLLPPQAIKAIGEVLEYGARKYTPNNWRLIDVDSHINHALTHIFNYFDTCVNADHPHTAFIDRQEELRHAACRMLMALEVFERGEWESDDPRLQDIHGPVHQGPIDSGLDGAGGVPVCQPAPHSEEGDVAAQCKAQTGCFDPTFCNAVGRCARLFERQQATGGH